MSVRKSTFRRSSIVLNRLTRKEVASSSSTDQPSVLSSASFDDLRKQVKKGGEFSKDLATIMTERAELEASYAKGIAKLSAKLFKSVQEVGTGTVSNAWHFVAEDMSSAADAHRWVSTSLVDAVVRPLKSFAESQHRTRKSAEASADKRSKILADWSSSASKAKAKCYGSCRDHERVMDQVLDYKLGRGRVLSEKELIKLETRRKKSETAVRKTNLDYYACTLRSERARLEWESSMMRGCAAFRNLEEERLEQLKTLADQYHRITLESRPKLLASAHRLQEPVKSCDIERDMEEINKKASLEADTMGEQILPTFYAEDQTNAMNRERRRDALIKFLRLIKSDIEREKKGKAGVENLAKAFKETPRFGNEDSQQDVQDKLLHMRSMLTYLEACRFKVLNSLLEIEGRPSASHPLASFIDSGKDKAGMSKAILKIPYWSRQEPQPAVDVEYYCSTSGCSSISSSEAIGIPPPPPPGVSQDRGKADGSFSCGSPVSTNLCRSPVLSSSSEFQNGCRGRADGGLTEAEDGGSSEFDDFSDGDEQVNIIAVVNGKKGQPEASRENEVNELYFSEAKTANNKRRVIGECIAIYDYAANMYDELSIKSGDQIKVFEKQEDGWWLGVNASGTVGIFPATYVEEKLK